MKQNIYTGIGARKTPEEVCTVITAIAAFLAKKKFVLRSGGAKGSDTAFEKGCDKKFGMKEIYLPHQYFNKNFSHLYNPSKEARKIAKEFHPAWHLLGETGRDFMSRNVHQVLGEDLQTPTNFIICWTPGGEKVGGTAQAIRIAEHHNIPVYNLFGLDKSDVDKLVLGLV